ncbi:MAG: Pyruvate dehydrogenase E1 component alpha subunit, partial [uncultured Rubrobacteraceae bacterium]
VGRERALGERGRGSHELRAPGGPVHGDGQDPGLRRSLPERLQAGQDRGLPPRLHRPGGGRDRLPRLLQRGRQGDHRLPRPRPRPPARHGPQGGHGRALRQGHGDGQGQGRLDAPLRRRAGPDGRLRHRRRSHTPGRRLRVRDALPGDGPHHPDLPRRRFHLQRRLPRGRQPRGALGQGRHVPGPLHHREQPVRDGDVRRADHRHDGPRREVRRLRHREREGRRHGRRGRPRSRREADRTGPRDRQALRRRGAHLQDRAPRRRRLLREVPRKRRDRGVAQARPDRDAREEAAGERRGRRGQARGDPLGGQGAYGRGREVRRRERGAGHRRALHRRLRRGRRVHGGGV